MKKAIQHIRKLKNLQFVWLYLYLFKAICAGLFVIPFFLIVNSALSLSDFSTTILSAWDFSVFVEMVSEMEMAIIPLILLMMVGAVVYMVIMQFINGGLYYIVVSGQYNNIDWGRFYSECGTNFGSHLRISILMTLIYFVMFPFGIFFANILGGLGSFLMGDLVMVIMFLKISIILLILTATSIFSDCLRSTASAYNDKGLKEQLKITADFFRPRIAQLIKLFIITYIPFLIIWISVELLSAFIVVALAGLLGIFLEFILFQVSSLARTGGKLWYLIVWVLNSVLSIRAGLFPNKPN